MPYTKDRSVYLTRRFVEYKDFRYHVPQVYSSGGTLRLERTRTGDSVTNYKSIIAKQGNATSAMQGTYDRYETDSAFGTWKFRFLSYDNPIPGDEYEIKVVGYLAPLLSVSNPILGVSEASNRAAIAFLKHARAVQREFSSPIFLGELKETLAMIRKPGQGLRNILNRYLNDLSKRKKKSPKDWKKNLSSAWLENSFGWQPLFQDLQSGYKAYRSLVERHKDENVIVSGFGIEEKDVPGASGYFNPQFMGSGGFLRGVLSYQTKDKAFVKFRGCVVRRVDVTLRNKLSRVGFDPSEFVPTVWELLPWSFLIDYFSNIGDVLESNAFNRADLAWAAQTNVQFRTTKGTQWVDADYLRSQKDYFVSFTGEPASALIERRVVSRLAVADIPLPTLSLELPGRPAQFANMLALWTQAVSLHPQSHRPKWR